MQSKGKIYNRFLISLLVIIILSLGSCNNPKQQYEVTVPVDKKIVADGFGDHNGSASEDELKFIEEYFKSNPEVWCVGYFSLAYWDKTQIPADTVLWAFKQDVLSGPCKSEIEIREAYEGLGIRTPYVGVYVLISDGECEITQLFQAPGPDVSKGKWIQMKIMSW